MPRDRINPAPDSARQTAPAAVPSRAHRNCDKTPQPNGQGRRTTVASNLPRLLALKKVADALDVSERTTRRLVDSGELPHVRVGGQIRVAVADLRVFIAQNRR